ncbi:hypothetical protein ACNJX9_04070 [Bradyrhizobium sp. DASA03076]|jgi:hypothetical protein|uniref:hypothetical protein n=1 Tax=Bradyrhizobium sp. BLXBL-03 TaxID=3395916 RepID=UPI003F6FFA7E
MRLRSNLSSSLFDPKPTRGLSVARTVLGVFPSLHSNDVSFEETDFRKNRHLNWRSLPNPLSARNMHSLQMSA